MKLTLEDVLHLEQRDSHVFRAINHKENFQGTLFGGQVLAQGLMAAGSTTELLPHSLHAYFLRPGLSTLPVDYWVTCNRDGRSFVNRTVEARQNGKTLLSMMVSFHTQERGFSHADDWGKTPKLPDEKAVKPPSELAPSQPDVSTEDFEFYPLTGGMFDETVSEQPNARFWMRTHSQLAHDPLTQACALTYASDFGLLATSLVSHPATLFEGDIMGASVDHALWFHASDFRVNDWLLYDIHSPWAGLGRGFSRGQIFNTKGTLIANSAQEGLVRPRSK